MLVKYLLRWTTNTMRIKVKEPDVPAASAERGRQNTLRHVLLITTLPISDIMLFSSVTSLLKSVDHGTL